MTHDFSISPSAQKQICTILSQQPSAQNQKMGVRILVDAGGCNGFQYKFSLDQPKGENDLLLEEDGARVIIDKTSLELLKGGTLEYEDKLMGAHFKIQNPQAASCCGCGNSFSLPDEDED